MALVGAIFFLYGWLFRFNDPSGAFAGLTDDHYFYLIRGWQILYGDLPVRDFVDHGAPLYYYVAAAVQMLFGRGTLSELAFSVTMIALGGTITFWLAARASGSILAGLVAALLQAWLMPRFYNYPKIIVYTAAIPLLWWFADRPRLAPLVWLAVTTALGFLFRFDHGAFVAAGVAATLLFVPELPWSRRLRFAAIYGVVTIVLLSPYFLFVEANGGVVAYLEQASAWAARERDRTPVVWPGLFDESGSSDEEREGLSTIPAVASVRDNWVAWWFYLELALPFFALAVLAMSRQAARPEWRRAGPKIAVVAVLAIVLNAGFLRSPLEARLADPSVPHAILIAWLVVAIVRLLRQPDVWQPALRAWRVPLAAATAVVAAFFAAIFALTVSYDAYDKLDAANLTDSFTRPYRRAVAIAEYLRTDWELDALARREDRPQLVTLSVYLAECTGPHARILVQPYIPAVLPLARRAFAGGHADLRPGFFTSRSAQELTLERLRRQDVPVVLLETGDSLQNFRKSFPLITAWLDEHYVEAGTHLFDERYGITLLLRKELQPTHSFPELGWPCAV
jgi:hypothetical protein